MSSMNPNNTFIWFMGRVVDINDPKKLGRARVRVPAYHDELEDEEIPWATPINPIQSASHYGIGISPLGLINGSMVFGFFADGSDARIPILFGSIAKINFGDEAQHDVSYLARETNIIAKNPLSYEGENASYTEPSSTYNAKYPYNRVIQTLSGHVIELDDTPGANRIHIFHSSGTYIEISDDGTKVTKTDGDNHDIVAKDNKVFINGKSTIIVKEKCKIVSDKSIVLKAPKISLNGEDEE